MSLKSDTLKLSPILAQYLHDHKELSLNGIGRFRIDPGPEKGQDAEKNSPVEISSVIRFQNDSSVKEDEALVDFISLQTGKMKSLASSDLDSHLELAKQFLNIGKPFLIEGIGILTKNKSGKLDFTPGNIFNEKIKEHTSSDADQSSPTEESFTDYEEMLSPQDRSVPFSRKLILWFVIIAGIGLAVWGGYLIYKKTNKPNPENLKESANVLVEDSATLVNLNNSAGQLNASVTNGTSYKFIIEKADSSRALTRYADLKNYGLDIQMETDDSIIYKLFFKITAMPADTARIRDSINIWYGTRTKTTIEF